MNLFDNLRMFQWEIGSGISQFFCTRLQKRKKKKRKIQSVFLITREFHGYLQNFSAKLKSFSILPTCKDLYGCVFKAYG